MDNNKRPLVDSYDAIIIGSGIGGLVCGCYLAKVGLKTLIVEKNYKIGGYCTSFKRKGFIFNSGAHLVGSCGPKENFGKLLNLIGVEIDFLRLDPSDIIHFNTDEAILVEKDYKDFKSKLKNEFKKEKNNIERFFKDILEISNPFLAGYFMKKYSNKTYGDFLSNYFNDKKLKAILSAQCGFLGLPPQNLSALAAIYAFKIDIIDGSYIARGGAQKIADAMVEKYLIYNGDLLTSTKVKKIICENNKVIGVEFENGIFIKAKYLISNIDAQATCLELLDNKQNKLSNSVLNKLTYFQPSISCFNLFLGVKNDIDTIHKDGWYYPSYDIDDCFNELIYLSIPTNYDTSLINNDKIIIQLYKPFVGDYNKIKDWKSEKNSFINNSLEILDNFFGNLSENILFCDAATPNTFNRYTNNSEGSLYGWKQTPEQTYINSFPSNIGIENLFLAGHWTYPGGGIVSVAKSGYNLARNIAKHIES